MNRSLWCFAHSALFLVTFCFVTACAPKPGAKDNFPKPDIPVVEVEARDGFVTLSWQEINNAPDGYRIYWSTTSGVTKDSSTWMTATSPPYKHSGLDNGKTYYYAMTAVGHGIESDLSKEVAANPQSPPVAPQNVRAIIVDGVATLTWDAVANAERYKIYVTDEQRAAGKSYETRRTALAFGNLDDSKTHYFAIEGTNVGGDGAWSATVTVAPVTVAIAAGKYHNCAIRPDRALECWGTNNFGQLGLGDNARRTSPVQVGAYHDWRRVTAGGNHTCAINMDGKLYCWGQNTEGQLGRSDPTYISSPSQIGLDTDWQSVSAGAAHTCAIKINHTLWCWGNNDNGQLGGSEIGSQVSAPTRVLGDLIWSVVSAGDNHTCGVQLDRIINCWGSNDSGQLGVTAPNPVGFIQIGDEGPWTRVAVGSKHSCAIKADTSLWCWGRNAFGQLGNGESGNSHSTPQRVGTDLGWTSVELGKEHSCAMRIDGRLWCWGDNLVGQLGLDQQIIQLHPTETSLANSWHSVALGDVHTCALFADGRFGCWGENRDAQLGKGTATRRPEPVSVSPDGDWLSIIAGWYHVCAIKTDFSLWCWGGSGTQGVTPTQSGFGKQASHPGWKNVAMAHSRACALRADNTIWCTSMNYGFIPKFFSGQQFGSSVEEWLQVAVTDNTTCALRKDRTIWCWGTTYDNKAPVFDSTGQWESIALTAQGVCAIKRDGSRWCQQNGSGALVPAGGVSNWQTLTVDGRCGIKFNGTLECITPAGFASNDVWTKLSSNTTGICAIKNDQTLWCGGVQIGTENSWTDISVSDNSPPNTPDIPGGFGDSYYCGVKLNHTLWCWGYTRYGQLANAAISSSSVPVSVQNAATWNTVSAGTYHTCAITNNDVANADQRLYCWGDNSYGQLGINSTTSASTPTPVDIGGRWIAVSAGAYHSCGINFPVSSTSGTLWCWGANGYGQVGVNSAEGKFVVPIKMGEDNDWIRVSTGDYHTCALKTTGALWCWGYNAYGQVGVGNRTVEIPPTLINSGTQWKTVTAGGHHTCAITVGDELRCWGANDNGQLGMGNNQDRLVPATIQTNVAKIWTAITAGSKHTCAITGGELWCWGDNSFGQLADGTEAATYRLIPQKSISSVSKVTAGGQHTCVTYLDRYGAGCSGANDSGQLGDGTTLPKTSPTQCKIGIQNSNSYPSEISISAGGQHTCAIREDRTMLCWGDNTNGQVSNSQ